MRYSDYLTHEDNYTLSTLDRVLRWASRVSKRHQTFRNSVSVSVSGKPGGMLKLSVGAVPGVWSTSLEHREGVIHSGEQEEALEPWSLNAYHEMARNPALSAYGGIRRKLIPLLLKGYSQNTPTELEKIQCLALLKPGRRLLPAGRPVGSPSGPAGVLEELLELPGCGTALLPELAKVWARNYTGSAQEQPLEISISRKNWVIEISAGGFPPIGGAVAIPTKYKRTGRVNISGPVGSIKDLIGLAKRGDRLYKELEIGRTSNEYNPPDRQFVEDGVRYSKHLCKKYRTQIPGYPGVLGATLEFIMVRGEPCDVRITGMHPTGVQEVLWGCAEPYLYKEEKVLRMPVSRGMTATRKTISHVLRECENLISGGEDGAN